MRVSQIQAHCLPIVQSNYSLTLRKTDTFFLQSQVSLYALLLFGFVAVPALTWGAVSRLVADARSVAPPFSCGPCVTRACIENERAESAMAYLGWMERRARGVVA